jgi:hypothetical protein
MVVLEVPPLVKYGMMASLDDARCGVEVDDVQICRRVAEEDTGKIVFVEFILLRASLLYVDMGAKGFQMREIGFASITIFVWGFSSSGVD